MASTFDISDISGVVYQGVGLGILAGVTMRTMDIVQQGFGQQPTKKGKKTKQKEWRPPMVFEPLKLKTPKW